MSGLPAFFCWVPAFDGDPAHERGALHRAETPGKARYLTYLQAKDAGFRFSFTEVRVRRAPEYDCAAFSPGVMPRFAKMPTEKGS